MSDRFSWLPKQIILLDKDSKKKLKEGADTENNADLIAERNNANPNMDPIELEKK